MKNNFSKKILSLFLIASMISHMTYLHSLLDDYVLCYGNDGHIAIEKLSDCNECSKIDLTNSSESAAKIYFDVDDCEDIPLIDNCFEDSDYVLDKKVNIQTALISDSKYFLIPQKNENKKTTNNLFLLNNTILKSYNTVSLLI